MKKIIFISALAITFNLGLTGCTPNISPDVVSASSATEIQNAVEGIVISKRAVTVKGDNNVAGTVGGAGLGALGGSQIGGGNTRYVTGLVGAIAGGIAGNMIQDKLTTQQGIEYAIKLDQQESGSATITTQGSTTNGKSKTQSSRSTTISGKSAAKRYITVIQGKGEQEIKVGQRVLVAGVGTKQARIVGIVD